MYHSLRYLLASCLFLTTTWAAGTFTQPTGTDGSNTFEIGQKITIAWTDASAYPIFSLGVYSTTNSTISWLISNSIYQPSSLDWTVDVDELGFDLSSRSLFKFYACNGSYFENSAFTLAFESVLFHVTSNYAPYYSSSSTSATASSTATSSSSSSSTATSSSTAVSNSSSPSSTLSVGAKAGIGIAVGIGALVLIGAAILFWDRKRRPAQRHQLNMSTSDNGGRFGSYQPVVSTSEKAGQFGSYDDSNMRNAPHSSYVQEMSSESAYRVQLPTHGDHNPVGGHAVELSGSSPMYR